MEIIPRAQWCTVPRAGVPAAIPTRLPRRWLHHGASGTSSIATANAYARWHILNRPPPRWIDVGYSWIVAEGKVLEARGPGRQGAHTYGDNRTSYGICLAGDYSSRAPADRDLDALVWLLRHGVDRGWWNVPTFTGGHRDAPGASTACPGGRLYRLIGDINKAAANPPDQKEDDDMPTAQEIVDALIPALRRERFAYYHEGRAPEGAWPTERYDTMTSRIRSRTERTLDRIATVEAEVAAVLATVAGDDVVQTVRDELAKHRDELADQLVEGLTAAITVELDDLPAEQVEQAVARALSRARLTVD